MILIQVMNQREMRLMTMLMNDHLVLWNCKMLVIMLRYSLSLFWIIPKTLSEIFGQTQYKNMYCKLNRQTYNLWEFISNKGCLWSLVHFASSLLFCLCFSKLLIYQMSYYQNYDTSIMWHFRCFLHDHITQGEQ